MAAKKVSVVGTRLATPAESQLVARFAQWEAESLTNLESGARQIIQLVSALLGVMLGTLALGDEKFATALQIPLVIVLASLILFAWLVALLAALAVVIPSEFLTRRASLDDMHATYQTLLQQRNMRLSIAVVAFGSGIVAFGGLILTLLLTR